MEDPICKHEKSCGFDPCALDECPYFEQKEEQSCKYFINEVCEYKEYCNYQVDFNNSGVLLCAVEEVKQIK